jgi:hypothetical protein
MNCGRLTASSLLPLPPFNLKAAASIGLHCEAVTIDKGTVKLLQPLETPQQPRHSLLRCPYALSCCGFPHCTPCEASRSAQIPPPASVASCGGVGDGTAARSEQRFIGYLCQDSPAPSVQLYCGAHAVIDHFVCFPRPCRLYR